MSCEAEMELAISDQNQAQLDLIREIVSECEANNVRIWLFGGWGIDALQGIVTREHGDIDMLAEESSRETLSKVLNRIGVCDIRPEFNLGKNGIGLDIGFTLTHSDGTVVSDVSPDDPNVYPWPPGSFPDECNGSLPGLSCRAISWEAQYIAKAGYRNAFPDTTPRTKDEADLETIARFLPADRRREVEEKWFGGIPREAPAETRSD